VVVTGSMRPWTAVSSDAQMNIINAIGGAACGETCAFGPVVPIGDEIHAPREATKAHTTSIAAFRSPIGPIGQVNGPRLHLNPGRAPMRSRTPFDLAARTESCLPRVGIVVAHPDAGAEQIDALADAGARGIVIAGAGAGAITPAMTRARDRALVRGVLIVIASRTGAGRVYPQLATGVLSAGDLHPLKARLLLQLCLAFSENATTAARRFAQHTEPTTG
jgi:L-asparaginase